MTEMWMVRAGEKGFLIEEFKKRNVAVIGWGIGDVAELTEDEIKALLRKKDPEKKGIGQTEKMIYKFRSVMKKGDYVISAYPKSVKYLLGIVESDYYYNTELIVENIDKDKKYNCFRNVKWISEISIDKFSKETKKSLEGSRTLFKINDAAKEEILNLKDSEPIYKSDEKRNKIYFGAPGTGKSYNLEEDMKKKFPEGINYERVTFHPDYSYANFVGTYKPKPKIIEEDGKTKEDITYKYVAGPFMRTLVKALKNPQKPFMLIIEEINRANVAAVFGDVFQLLDRDESYKSDYDIETSEDMRDFLREKLNCEYEKIRIPSNMFIWATMNSADQGVFPMDTAFKRRWDFKYFGINHDENLIDHIKVKLNNKIISWNILRKAINSELLMYGINEDKLIGPFFAFDEYLKDKNGEFKEITPDDFKEIFKNKIIMYLFEDAARARRNDLFAGSRSGNKNVIYSKICDDFDKKDIGIFTDKIRNNKKIFTEKSEAE